MRIALLPGDGIGPEITREAQRVLEALAIPGLEFEEALVGGAAYKAVGHPLPPETLNIARRADAILFGSVGDPDCDALDRHLRPEQAILGLRKAVAGDDSALYNALLLTLRDAAKVAGRKVVIVFSNGPDNASMVAPDDVRAVAEDEGIPIYVISTNQVNNDAVSSQVFKRLSTQTGGKTYFASTWQKQVEAFESIREDLGNSYTVTYYPQANPNEGFRKIAVELVNEKDKKLRVQARPGYRPRSGF